jgi:hypothetical protein
MSIYAIRKGESQRTLPLAGLTLLWDSWLKTMTIVSDYIKDYNEKTDFFG